MSFIRPIKRFTRFMNTRVEGVALGCAVISVAGIIFNLATGRNPAVWLPFLVGVWVGFFLMWGASRLFDWGESTATSIYGWAFWFGLVLVFPVAFLAPDIIREATFGFFVGAVLTADVIRRRLREKNHRA